MPSRLDWALEVEVVNIDRHQLPSRCAKAAYEIAGRTECLLRVGVMNTAPKSIEVNHSGEVNGLNFAMLPLLWHGIPPRALLHAGSGKFCR